jgi:phosphatidylglycerol:prolipoprotein diacylglycerol transferase
MAFPKNLSGYSAEPRHPTQLYDSLSGLMIFIILLALARKQKINEKLFLVFLLLYGASKFISEFFRAPDSFLGPVHYLSYSQIGALVAVILALLFLTFLKGIWQRILVRGRKHETFAP